MKTNTIKNTRIKNKNKKNALLEQTKNVSKNKPLAKENFYKTLEAFSDCV